MDFENFGLSWDFGWKKSCACMCLLHSFDKITLPSAISLSASFGYMFTLLPIQYFLLRFSNNFTPLLWPQWLTGCAHDTSTASNVNMCWRISLLSAVVKWEMPMSCLLPVGRSLSTEGGESKTERIREVKELGWKMETHAFIIHTLMCMYPRHNIVWLLRSSWPLASLSTVFISYLSGISFIHTPKIIIYCLAKSFTLTRFHLFLEALWALNRQVKCSSWSSICSHSVLTLLVLYCNYLFILLSPLSRV